VKSARDSFPARLVCAAALAIFARAAGAFPETFELERSALGQGELWRLWTGHLVHGSASHFGYDVGAAALLCVAFGPSLRLLWMAPLISIALLVALPEVQHYHGLSALLHAWVVVIAAEILVEERGARALIAAGLLLGTLGKAATETWTGASLFTAELDFGGPVLHASHLVGALIGCLPLVAGGLDTRRLLESEHDQAPRHADPARAGRARAGG